MDYVIKSITIKSAGGRNVVDIHVDIHSNIYML